MKDNISRKDKGVMSNIKIAYLLVAHKCPEQINTFVKQLLEYGDCDVYIHIDKKKSEMVNQIIKSNRVFIYSVYDVRWGSFEIVKAACYLMNRVKQSDRSYSHMYFGSGQDLLVKKGLYDFLDQNPEKIYLRIKEEIKNSDVASARYRIRWPKKLLIRNDLHVYRFIRIVMQYLCKFGIVLYKNKTKLKHKIHFYGGRTWFIAPISIMEYILNYIDENPEFVDFWKDSLASDLMFFQTIIMNSPYADQIEDELMYVEFGKTFGTKNHPLTITMDVVKNIEKGNYYFARKFEWNEKESIDYFLSLTRRN